MAKTKDEELFLINFGKRLRKLREKNGWTLEYCEEKGWACWQHLQRIESGKNITILTLRRLMKIYKIPLPKILE